LALGVSANSIVAFAAENPIADARARPVCGDGASDDIFASVYTRCKRSQHREAELAPMLQLFAFFSKDLSFLRLENAAP